MFKLHSKFKPTGDQPKAIEKITSNFLNNEKNQVLLGVTGSGKTFTMANVIQNIQKPTLVMAPNKTLAAQLYEEMKDFFPENAVEYFVSYYDYTSQKRTFQKQILSLKKESSINEYIDRLRHSATRSLLDRRDVIVVASVSCIYGIGSRETYGEMVLNLKVGDESPIHELAKKFTELQYKRNDYATARGMFSIKGDTVDIFPVHYEGTLWRISFFGDDIESIMKLML